MGTIAAPEFSRVSVPTSHRRIFASAAVVATFTSLAKLAGAAKVVATARFFGTSDGVDAFLIAFLFPSFVSDVIAGSFTSSLVPVLVRTLSAAGVEASRELARSALGFAISLMALGAAALAILGHWLLRLAGSSFSDVKLHLALGLFLGLLLWLPMSAAIATWRAVLHAHQRFAMAAFAPIATPALTIVFLYAFASRWDVKVLCIGTVAGVGLECLMLALAVRQLGYPIAPALKIDGRSWWRSWTVPELHAVRSQYWPLAGSLVITSGCVVVDQFVAGSLGPGRVSALSYGNKLPIVVLAVIVSAVSTVVLPAFSKLAASGDWQRLRHSVVTYAGILALGALPVAALLIYLSPAIVHTFYEHGAFQPSASQMVTGVQRFSFLQLPFAILFAIASRLTAAISANALLLRVGAAALATDIVCDLAFSHWFGVAGIALATPVVQCVSLLVLITLLRGREPRLFSRAPFSGEVA